MRWNTRHGKTPGEQKSFRIPHGVQTTGNGHMSRSSLMISRLKAMGHQVDVLFSGASGGSFRDLAPLELYHRCKGLTFVAKNGRIDPFRTAFQIDFYRAYRDISRFRNDGCNAVISDFEPLSARIAKHFDIPPIGVSHQCTSRLAVPSEPSSRQEASGQARIRPV